MSAHNHHYVKLPVAYLRQMLWAGIGWVAVGVAFDNASAWAVGVSFLAARIGAWAWMKSDEAAD